jgi:hypothetical protein
MFVLEIWHITESPQDVSRLVFLASLETRESDRSSLRLPVKHSIGSTTDFSGTNDVGPGIAGFKYK